MKLGATRRRNLVMATSPTLAKLPKLTSERCRLTSVDGVYVAELHSGLGPNLGPYWDCEASRSDRP